MLALTLTLLLCTRQVRRALFTRAHAGTRVHQDGGAIVSLTWASGLADAVNSHGRCPGRTGERRGGAQPGHAGACPAACYAHASCVCGRACAARSGGGLYAQRHRDRARVRPDWDVEAADGATFAADGDEDQEAVGMEKEATAETTDADASEKAT